MKLKLEDFELDVIHQADQVIGGQENSSRTKSEGCTDGDEGCCDNDVPDDWLCGVLTGSSGTPLS